MRIELLPKSVIGHRQRQRLVRGWIVGLSATGVAMVVGVLVLDLALGGRIVGGWEPGPRAALAGDAAGSLDGLTRIQADIDQLIEAENAAREALREVMARLAANRAMADAVDWSALLETVASVARDGVVLGRVGLGPSGNRSSSAGGPGGPGARSAANPVVPGLVIEIDGVGRTPREVSAFVLQLEALSLFDHVNLLETRGQSINGGTVSTFRIRCHVQDRTRGGA